MEPAIPVLEPVAETAGMAIPSNSAREPKNVDLTELVGTQLFKQVSMAQVAALLRFCPTLALMNGERLIVPGQTVNKIHLLVQGRLQVFEGESSDKPVGEIRQGECVGLSSFVDRLPCHVSIVSDGVSRVLVLDEERMTALINTPTAVSRNLLFMLMSYLRNKATRAAEAATAAPAPVLNNHTDAVTGLHNQRWLEETLDRLILRAATDRAPLSLLAVELNDLPGLTAQYEQEMLDLSLRAMADNLSKTIRPTDLIARHASGRFVIMLPETNQETADAVAARIQEAINNMDVVIPGTCVLPPMKIDVGGVQMKAFVSGRKLVDDAFAALARNRALHEAAKAAAAAEAAQAALLAEQAAAMVEAQAAPVPEIATPLEIAAQTSVPESVANELPAENLSSTNLTVDDGSTPASAFTSEEMPAPEAPRENPAHIAA